MVLPSSGSRVFYELMGQYREEEKNISMGNIDLGSEYLTILQDHFIYKVHSKVAYTVDYRHVPGVIYGCAVAGQV